MNLTELVRKHLDRLVEASITIRQHTRHSKKGKTYSVKTYQRTLPWIGTVANFGIMTANVSLNDVNLKYSIQKHEGDYELTKPGGDKWYYDTLGQAKKAAYQDFTNRGR